MLILIVMTLGAVWGYFWFPAKMGRVNSWVQTICTAILIFSMGVSLGSKPDFFQELSAMGWDSLLFALIPIVLSVIFVYALSRKFLEPKKGSRSSAEREGRKGEHTW